MVVAVVLANTIKYYNSKVLLDERKSQTVTKTIIPRKFMNAVQPRPKKPDVNKKSVLPSKPQSPV